MFQIIDHFFNSDEYDCDRASCHEEPDVIVPVEAKVDIQNLPSTHTVLCAMPDNLPLALPDKDMHVPSSAPFMTVRETPSTHSGFNIVLPSAPISADRSTALIQAGAISDANKRSYVYAGAFECTTYWLPRNCDVISITHSVCNLTHVS
jgi:hypothetical protein